MAFSCPWHTWVPVTRHRRLRLPRTVAEPSGAPSYPLQFMPTTAPASRRVLSSRRAVRLAVLACAAWLAAAGAAHAQEEEETLQFWPPEELPAPIRDEVEPPED